MNLGHPFLIYGLCKQAGVPVEDNEAWIHPIKAIMVKKDKPGVPRLEEVYDSGNEPSDEDELRAYQSRFGIPVGTQGEVGLSSTQPLLPQPSLKEDPVKPSTTLEDRVQDLATRFDVYWDETQEHRVLISQEMIPFEPTCARSCITRRPSSAISSPSRISLPSSSRFTCHLHHYHSDLGNHQGSSLHPFFLFYRH